MNIYDGEGGLDIGLALEELKATALISSEKAQRSRIAEITAAALLDIAGSLRPIGAEAYAAMAPDPDYVETAPGIYETPRADLEAGDLVHVIGTERSGEVVGIGYDGDNTLVATVSFGEGSADMTYYARQLERLVGDERPHVSTPDEDAEMIDADDLPELFADSATDGLAEQATIAERDGVYYQGEGIVEHAPDIDDVEPEVVEHDARELVEDDIDADFDGDEHDEAEDAVARLKANEAARKAAKKAAAPKKKGGKK